MGNRYFVIVLGSWHTAPKTLGTSRVHASEMTGSWGSLESFRKELATRKTKSWLESWILETCLWTSGKWKGPAGLNSITKGQWFNQFAHRTKALGISLNRGMWRSSGWVNTRRCWKGGVPGEGMEASCLHPLTPLAVLPLTALSYASLLFGCPWIVPFITDG